MEAPMPILTPEAELVVYRVAQEALTNVARHSGVATAKLELSHRDDTLTLTVIDAGRGLPQGHQPGTGIRGMSERAALIGATLAIEDAGGRGGVRVLLEVPLDVLDELDEFEPVNGAAQPGELLVPGVAEVARDADAGRAQTGCEGERVGRHRSIPRRSGWDREDAGQRQTRSPRWSFQARIRGGSSCQVE